MSHGTHADHGSGSTATANFSPAEVETFHAEDRSAATAIVGLMVGIFAMGLVGYLVVCYWVS
jgi:hypothetical protein